MPSIKFLIAIVIGVIIIVLASFFSSKIAVQFCDPNSPYYYLCPPTNFNVSFTNLKTCSISTPSGSSIGDIWYVDHPSFPFVQPCFGGFPNTEFCSNGIVIHGSDGVIIQPSGLFGSSKIVFLDYRETRGSISAVRINNRAYIFEIVHDNCKSIASALECCDKNKGYGCNSDSIDGARTKEFGIVSNIGVEASSDDIKREILGDILKSWCNGKYCLLCEKDKDEQTKTSFYICGPTFRIYPKEVKVISVEDNSERTFETGIINVSVGEVIEIDGRKWKCNENLDWEKVW